MPNRSPRQAKPKKQSPNGKPPLIPQEHGGALYAGGVRQNRGGVGGLRDAFRADLRLIAADDGLPFLRTVFREKVPVRFVGTCPKCGVEVDERGLDPNFWQRLQERVSATVDHRLKANEQALRYGLGTQIETMTREDIDAEARALMGELCRILLEEERWPQEKVRSMVDRAVSAVRTTIDGGASPV